MISRRGSPFQRLTLVYWPGAAAQAVAFGRALLARDAPVAVALPGAFVFEGWDHALIDGHFQPTHRAWGRGTEAMVPLSETPTFAPIAGIDDTTHACWARIPGL